MVSHGFMRVHSRVLIGIDRVSYVWDMFWGFEPPVSKDSLGPKTVKGPSGPFGLGFGLGLRA